MFRLSNIIYENLKKGDIVFYSRVLPKNNYYKVMDLRIVSIYNNYCTGTDLKTKQTYVFDRKLAEEALFYNKKDALYYLDAIKKRNDKV